MHDLFISYAREDADWVEKFCTRLQTQGLSVWKDSSIPTGRSFGRVIEQAVAEASVVVVVWSTCSVESDWVRAEALEGLRRDILVPLLKERCDPPLRYRTLQTSDLSDWRFEADHPGFQAMLAACRSIIGGTAAQTMDVPPARKAPLAPPSRRLRLKLAVSAVILTTAALSTWLWLEEDRRRQRSLELTVSANSLLTEIETLDKSSRLYWRFFLDRQSGRSMAERAVLLALEAVIQHPSAEALDALESGLVLLPRTTGHIEGNSNAASAAISPDGNLAAWSQREIIQVRNLHTPERSVMLDNKDHVSFLRFVPGPYPLLAVGSRGSVSLWRNGTRDKRVLTPGNEASVLALALDHEGSRLALHQHGLVTVLDLLSGRQIASFETETDPLLGAEQSLDLSPDGNLLAYAERRRVSVRDLSQGKLLYQFTLEHPVTGLGFDPSGETLSVASTAGGIQLVQAGSGETARRLQGPAARILQFSPDGRFLARSAAGRVEVSPGKDPDDPLLTYGHDDNVIEIAFSPDGQLVASGGQDGLVRVWDLARRRELLRQGFMAKVLTLGFSPGQASLTLVTSDGEVARLPLSYDDPVREACRALARDLTLEEWQRYLPDEPYRRRCPGR